MSLLEILRIPTKSSEILQTMFGLTPQDMGKLARDLTELASPTVQGKNAYILANYIIDNQIGGSTSNEYAAAIFF